MKKTLGLLTLACAAVVCGIVSAQEHASSGVVGADGRVFIVEHSHSDIAWVHTIEGEAAVRNKNFAKALELMRKDPTFKWTVECVLYFQNWLDEHPETEAEVIDLVRRGQIDCGATYTQPLEDCCYNELLVRQMYVGKRWFEKRFPGTNLQLVMNQDSPLRGHQVQQVYSKAGVRYLKGSRMNTPGFFYWCSPDGSRLLSWFQEGYWGLPYVDGKYLLEQLDFLAAQRAKHSLPPVLGITYGWDYTDPMDYATNIANWNKDAAANNRPPIAYGTFTDVLRAAESCKVKLEEIHGGVPNWWSYEEWLTHVAAMQWHRTAGKYLPMAETFQTIKSLLQGNFAEYPAESLAKAWTDASFLCHTMVPSPNDGPAPQDVMKEKYRQAADVGRGETQAAIAWIANRVKPQRDGVPVVVFNGLSWTRTDPVEVAMPEGAKTPPVVVDAKGEAVPCQVVSGNRLAFIASEVPALGYKTYYIASGKETAAEPAKGTGWTAPFESDHYRITPTPGGLASVFDKELGRELFRTNRWQGAEWTSFQTNAMGACEGIDFEPILKGFWDRSTHHKPAWTCEESGPVFVRWAMDAIKTTHCQFRMTVTAYRHLKRIDFAAQVRGNDSSIWREQRLIFPFNATNAEIAYEVPFGVVRAGVDEPFEILNKGVFGPAPKIPSYPREIQNWVTVSAEGVGITLGSSIGGCAFADFGEGADATQPVIAPVLMASPNSPDGKGRPQPGDCDYAFSLYSHPAGRQQASRLGTQSQVPLLAVIPGGESSPKTLPETCSFFTPTASNVAISTIKKAEDDDSVIVRLYDMDGSAVDAKVQSRFPISSAQAVDMIERGGTKLTSEAGSFCVPVKAWGIETVKIDFERKPSQP